MNHSGRFKKTRGKRHRKERRTRRGGMKRARSSQSRGRTSPPKYQGVPAVPMGIPVQQNPQEQMPPMGIPLGRGVSRRRHLKKRRRSRKMRGGGMEDLMGTHNFIPSPEREDLLDTPFTLVLSNISNLTWPSIGYVIGGQLTILDTNYNVRIKYFTKKDTITISNEEGTDNDINKLSSSIDMRNLNNTITQLIKDNLMRCYFRYDSRIP